MKHYLISWNHGVVVWNKNSIEFENGTRIQVSATTANSLRGRSVNLLICLTGKNKIEIQENNGNIKTLSFEELEDLMKN